jgi:hypothetical protein
VCRPRVAPALGARLAHAVQARAHERGQRLERSGAKDGPLHVERDDVGSALPDGAEIRVTHETRRRIAIGDGGQRVGLAAGHLAHRDQVRPGARGRRRA